MRDIRDHLLERLKKTAAERHRLQTALRALDIQEAAVKALLEAEDQQLAGDSTFLLKTGDPASPAIAAAHILWVFRRFVLECLNDKT